MLQLHLPRHLLPRPGGNLTGINFLNAELVAKRLELLRELGPGVARVAVLVNPAGPLPIVETVLREVEGAARAMGLQVQVLNASTNREIDAAFGALVRERVDALFVSPGEIFNSRRVQLATMAARHGIPMTSATREIAEAGGLMSYGANLADVWHSADKRRNAGARARLSGGIAETWLGGQRQRPNSFDQSVMPFTYVRAKVWHTAQAA